MANVMVVLNVGPVSLDILLQSLEFGNSLFLIVQIASIPLDQFLVICVLALLRLQFDNLLVPKVGENAAVSNGLLDLIKALLELTHAANSHMVHVCAAPVLIIGSGVLVKYMAVTDTIDMSLGLPSLSLFS